MEEPEEFEHLPWSELSAAHQSGRNRTIYVAAAVLVVLAIGVVVARSFIRPAPAAVAEPVVTGQSVTTTPALPTGQPTVAATIVVPAARLSSPRRIS